MFNFHRHRRPPSGLSEKELQQNPSWRRYSQDYIARKRIVRSLWTYVGLLVIVMPLPAQVFTLLLLMFVSFSVLDAEGKG